MTPSLLRLLRAIVRYPTTSTVVAAVLDVDRRWTSRQLCALERRGLVSRGPHAVHQGPTWTATPEGVATAKRDLPPGPTEDVLDSLRTLRTATTPDLVEHTGRDIKTVQNALARLGLRPVAYERRHRQHRVAVWRAPETR